MNEIHRIEVINPSVPHHTAKFRSFERLNQSVKHSTKFSHGKQIYFNIDTTEINDEHHNEFGKKLSALVTRYIKSSFTFNSKLARELVNGVSAQFDAMFIDVERSVSVWIQHKKYRRRIYQLKGSIDAVLWNTETRQFMILDWKAKPNAHVDYWSKGGRASQFWTLHFPQTIAYARALRCIYNLHYEPKIIIVACSRSEAYARLITSYDRKYYQDDFLWTMSKPRPSLLLPSSLVKPGVNLSNGDTPLAEVFTEEATLIDLMRLLHIEDVQLEEVKAVSL